MSNVKETQELNQFAGRLINGLQSDAADGFNPAKDFAKYIPAMLAAQPGFQGLSEYRNEAVAAGVQEKEILLNTLKSEIKGGSDVDNYDLAQGLHGIQMLLSYAFRKGRADMLAEVEAAGMDVSAFSA